jgi:hypothetical protein
MVLEGFPLGLGTLLSSLWPMIGLFATAMLLSAVGQRRNWARLILLVVSSYGIALTFLAALLDFHRAPLLISVDVAVGIATIYALALLFCRASNAWFRRSDTANKSSAVV